MVKQVKRFALIVGCVCLMSTPLMALSQPLQQSLRSPLDYQTSILSHFGENRGSYMHQGIDVAAPIGMPLYAVADGKVMKAAPDSKGVNAGGGHMIFLDHGDGTESRYMHLSGYMVNTGDFVKAGDLIGFTGASGDATAPILHYEYRIYGQPVDPYFIFESWGSLPPVEDAFVVTQH